MTEPTDTPEGCRQLAAEHRAKAGQYQPGSWPFKSHIAESHYWERRARELGLNVEGEKTRP